MSRNAFWNLIGFLVSPSSLREELGKNLYILEDICMPFTLSTLCLHVADVFTWMLPRAWAIPHINHEALTTTMNYQWQLTHIFQVNARLCNEKKNTLDANLTVKHHYTRREEKTTLSHFFWFKCTQTLVHPVTSITRPKVHINLLMDADKHIN